MIARRNTLLSELHHTCAPWSITLLAAVLAVTSWCARAAPSGGSVAAGQATVQNQGTSTRITQSSANAIVNWQSFDVAAGESVIFVQPSASAIMLNRVSSNAASTIAGNVSANGRFFNVNHQAVIFSGTARVSAAGIVATTADIDNNKCMQGQYEFRAPGNDAATVVNHGNITAFPGGRVALLAPHVENNGSITARQGVVVLATGQIFLIDLFGDGLVQVATAHLEGRPAFTPVTNIGTVRIDSGTLLVRSLLQPLQGTVNGVNANQAATAVQLPGGSVAFVGSPASGSVQSAFPDWLGPGVVAVGTQLQGAGIIDATPTYSIPAQGDIQAQLTGATVVGAAPGDRTLAQFNRLSDSIAAVAPDAARRDSEPLYTLNRGAPQAAADEPVLRRRRVAGSPVSARKAASSSRRFCTVTEVLHTSSASCR